MKSDEICLKEIYNDKVNISMQETGMRYEQILVLFTILKTKFSKKGKNHTKSDSDQILGFV